MLHLLLGMHAACFVGHPSFIQFDPPLICFKHKVMCNVNIEKQTFTLSVIWWLCILHWFDICGWLGIKYPELVCLGRRRVLWWHDRVSLFLFFIFLGGVILAAIIISLFFFSLSLFSFFFLTCNEIWSHSDVYYCSVHCYMSELFLISSFSKEIKSKLFFFFYCCVSG